MKFSVPQYGKGYGSREALYLLLLLLPPPPQPPLLRVCIYRVSQEECAGLREGVPYVKEYRYNPKHLCPKLTVTEIKAREKCGLLAVPRTLPGSRDVIPICCALSVLVYSQFKRVPRCDCTCKVLGNPKDNYDMSASVFVVQFNGFMSLTS